MRIARIGFILGLLTLSGINIGCNNYNESSSRQVSTLVFSDTITIGDLVSPYVYGNSLLGSDSLVLAEGRGWISDYPNGMRLVTTCNAIELPEGTVFQRRNREWFMYHPYGRRFTNDEYFSPYALSSLNSGDYLEYDIDSLSIVVYDSLGNQINSIFRSWVLPYSIQPGTDSVAVIKELGYSYSQPKGAGYRIFSINMYTGEEIATFRNHFFTDELERSIYSEKNLDLTDKYSVHAVDADGNVYISDYGEEEYIIKVYSPAGDEIKIIQFDSSLRLEYDHDEYWIPEALITFFYYHPQGECLGRIFLNYPELHPYVTRLEILGDEIWARRSGTRSTEYWDVISMDGELLRRVTLYAEASDNSAYPMLIFNDNGYFGIYREDFCNRSFTVKNLND
ncbi:MAG: hypothetical protein K8S15_04510 [Candidatus Aegiribacteria sp.]|nr:hypothetical protein [Candidatus Aegiribacteria sp.]